MSSDERDAIIRLIRRSELDPDTGCWLVQGRRTGKGYPATHIGTKPTVNGHRLALAATGVDVTGKHAHHACPGGGVKHCINPAHLRALTPAQHNAVHARLRREAKNAA